MVQSYPSTFVLDGRPSKEVVRDGPAKLVVLQIEYCDLREFGKVRELASYLTIDSMLGKQSEV